MAEKPEKIQLAQQIAGLLDKANNTSLKKHPTLPPRKKGDERMVRSVHRPLALESGGRCGQKS